MTFGETVGIVGVGGALVGGALYLMSKKGDPVGATVAQTAPVAPSAPNAPVTVAAAPPANPLANLDSIVRTVGSTAESVLGLFNQFKGAFSGGSATGSTAAQPIPYYLAR